MLGDASSYVHELTLRTMSFVALLSSAADETRSEQGLRQPSADHRIKNEMLPVKHPVHDSENHKDAGLIVAIVRNKIDHGMQLSSCMQVYLPARTCMPSPTTGSTSSWPVTSIS